MNKKADKLEKVWSLRIADRYFAQFIVERDGKCLRCKRTGRLECSHFWNRTHWATRYDPDNCISLCCPCHAGNSKGWEYEQQGEYRDFMTERLGKEKYDLLEAKHREFKSKRETIKECMYWLKPYRKKQNEKNRTRRIPKV